MKNPDQKAETDADPITAEMGTNAPANDMAIEAAEVDADAKAAEAKAKAPRKAKVLDAAKLRELIAVVEGGNTKLHQTDLVARLALEEGAKLIDSGAVYSVSMAGITASATSGVGMALTNWCSAARRKCLSGEAA